MYLNVKVEFTNLTLFGKCRNTQITDTWILFRQLFIGSSYLRCLRWNEMYDSEKYGRPIYDI